jgi:hypothetical protein
MLFFSQLCHELLVAISTDFLQTQCLTAQEDQEPAAEPAATATVHPHCSASTMRDFIFEYAATGASKE